MFPRFYTDSLFFQKWSLTPLVIVAYWVFQTQHFEFVSPCKEYFKNMDMYELVRPWQLIDDHELKYEAKSSQNTVIFWVYEQIKGLQDPENIIKIWICMKWWGHDTTFIYSKDFMIMNPNMSWKLLKYNLLCINMLIYSYL